MLKNITLSADQALIQRSRERAAAENTTINTEFRRWLLKYAESVRDGDEFIQLMDQLAYVQAGGTFGREAMNER
ncbi:MAG: hypothetical protein KKD28_04945 [Chloroflexi bacterium]|nr:hypothetical protein [Chloroflexota bacterium]